MHPTLTVVFAALAALPAAAGPSRPPPPVVVPVVIPVELADDHDVRRRAHGHDWPRGHDGAEVRCSADVDASFAALDDALYALADEIDDQHGRARRALRDELAAVVAAAEEARERACRAARTAPPPPAIVILAPATEAQLKSALRAESFDDARVRTLETALRGDVCVTPQQARGLVETMSFGRGRLDALARIAPRIVDDGTAFTLLEAFTFASEKRDAQRTLQGARALPACRPR